MNSNRAIAADERDAIIALRRAGASYKEIIAATRRSCPVVTAVLRDAGMFTRLVVTPLLVECMRELAAAGAGNGVIAAEVGVSYSTVLRVLGKRHGPSPETVDTIVEMRENGSSVKEVCAELGMSSSVVQYHSLRAGVGDISRIGVGSRRNHLRKTGVRVRAFSADEDAEILRMRKDGHLYSAIGRALGRRHHVISARLYTLARRDALLEEAA
tara:strand:+ start:84 stop:722 length:639 start_codon:yes stop_codon:yes gene_type:complete